jgi:hypothetical protein
MGATMTRQHAAPIVIDSLELPRQIVRLERVRRSLEEGHSNRFQEKLLQRLIDTEPKILPVEELEPSFANLRSVCRELPLGRDASKFVDNLLINAEGRICLVECKLWRNPEAIRSVVAQVLDYAGELASLSYEELSAAVRKAARSPLSHDNVLIERVLGADADEESRVVFIDAVSRSLRLGNFLLLVVGDGIRSGLQQIAGLLQNRATLGFSFALIEMAIYENKIGGSSFYVQPRLLLQTEIITRTVFVLEDRGAPQVMSVSTGGEPQTISEQEFFAALANADPTYPDALRSFLDRCSALGCQPELRRRYVLYVDDPTGGRINLGTIGKNGTVEIWGAASRDQQLGEPIGRHYMDQIAAFLSQAYVKDDLPSPGSWTVRYKDKVGIPMREMLPHQDAWLKAIQEVINRFRDIESRQSESSVQL